MKIAGKDKFLRQIGALPQALRAEIRRALEVSAEEATDLMKRFAPEESGDLKASIGHSFDDAPAGALKSAAREAKAETGLAVTMFAGGEKTTRRSGKYPYDYAMGQEHGTQDMPANPFFYPGYRLARKRAKARLARALRNGMKKAMK